MRYTKESQLEGYYAKRQRFHKTSTYMLGLSEINSAKVAGYVESRRRSDVEVKNLEILMQHHRKPVSKKSRRIAIQTIFDFSGVGRDLWSEYGVVIGSMSRLLIPKGSRQSVEKVLDYILEAQYEHSSYDPSRSLSSRGRHPSIDCKKDIDLILNCQMNDISIIQTTIIFNYFRADDTPARSTLSWSTVVEFVRNSPLIMKLRRAGHRHRMVYVQTCPCSAVALSAG